MNGSYILYFHNIQLYRWEITNNHQMEPIIKISRQRDAEQKFQRRILVGYWYFF
jgi:hypothetical protein